MNPQLQEYVAQARAHGLVDPQIKEDLLKAGWQEEQLTGLFTVSEVATLPEQVEPVKKDRRKLWIIGGPIAGVLLLLIIGISVAEAGYWPAFSRLYRKTYLPLAWHGTTANAGLALGQGTLAVLDAKPVAVVSKVNISATINAVDLSSLSLLTPDTSGKALADVPSTSTPTKINVQMTNTLGVGNDGTIYESVNYPESQDTSVQQAIGQYLNPTFTTLTLDAIFPSTGNTIYARTNAAPVPTSADQNKWFSFDIGSGNTVSSSKDAATKQLNTDSSSRTALMNLINGVTVDHGVIRHNNEAEAWYTSTLTPQNIVPFETNTGLSQDVRDQIKSTADGWKTGTITIQWYLTARSPELTEVDVTLNNVDQDGTTASGTINSTFSYGAAVKATGIPAKNDTWSSEEDYVQALISAGDSPYSTGIVSGPVYKSYVDLFTGGINAVETGEDSLATTTIDADNSARQSDLIEYAKAFQTYLVTNGDTIPSTNGTYVRLDSSANQLCNLGIGVFPITCNIKDPDTSSPYYYSYWSDGTNFRVVAVHVAEDGTQDGFYYIDQSTSSPTQVATLP